jgi:hypothetical protein
MEVAKPMQTDNDSEKAEGEKRGWNGFLGKIVRFWVRGSD